MASTTVTIGAPASNPLKPGGLPDFAPPGAEDSVREETEQLWESFLKQFGANQALRRLAMAAQQCEDKSQQKLEEGELPVALQNVDIAIHLYQKLAQARREQEKEGQNTSGFPWQSFQFLACTARLQKAVILRRLTLLKEALAAYELAAFEGNAILNWLRERPAAPAQPVVAPAPQVEADQTVVTLAEEEGSAPLRANQAGTHEVVLDPEDDESNVVTCMRTDTTPAVLRPEDVERFLGTLYMNRGVALGENGRRSEALSDCKQAEKFLYTDAFKEAPYLHAEIGAQLMALWENHARYAAAACRYADVADDVARAFNVIVALRSRNASNEIVGESYVGLIIMLTDLSEEAQEAVFSRLPKTVGGQIRQEMRSAKMKKQKEKKEWCKLM
eukprot:TRINITY_DN6071_c0_g1_i1.p1 TRINITY_DN6071_c0_g1~~TRINITY_DN6071_c0_g1_i1.p1  ORF type:complete len:388 (-),score=98.01 TRINITY_DN6071_c0_g1_i1:305-1468(-)